MTGFGFVGHLSEMAQGSNVSVEVAAGALPVMESALDYAESGLLPGGLHKNRVFYGPIVDVTEGVRQALVDVMFDPQTSGGLLIAVPESRVDELMRSLAAFGLETGAGSPGRRHRPRRASNSNTRRQVDGHRAAARASVGQ